MTDRFGMARFYFKQAIAFGEKGLAELDRLDAVNEDDADGWVTPAEAAERLGFAENTIRLWCQQDPSIGRKDGGRWLCNIRGARRRAGMRSESP